MPLTGYSTSLVVKATNNSGAAKTNPVIPLHLLPYTAIQQGTWVVDGSVYHYRIPVRITEMTEGALTNYNTRVGPIDTKWLKDNGWATSSGNEARWTDSDGSTLLSFWLEDFAGWNSHETYYHVRLSLTASQQKYVYFYCDPLLTSKASASTTSIFTKFEDFSGYTGGATALAGITSPSGTDVPTNFLVAVKATAAATGTATHIRVRSSVNSNVKVALYNDASGTPGSTIHDQCSAGHACTAGQVNDIPLDNQNFTVQQGTDYWLLFTVQTNGGVVRNSTSSGTAKYRTPWTYSNAFPTSHSWGGNLSYQYAIQAANIVTPSLSGWSITGYPSYSGGVLTLQEATITSSAEYGTGKQLRMHLKRNAYSVATFGFRKADDSLYAEFIHHGTGGHPNSVRQYNGTSSTQVDYQSPYPTDEYALWDVKRRTDNPGSSKSAWVRYNANNVLLTDAPVKTNCPAGDIPIRLATTGSGVIDAKWLLATDYVSPEPLVEVPQLYHHPDVLFCNSAHLNWPYDTAVTKEGETQELYYYMDELTLHSEYGTVVYVKYSGTVNDGQSVYLEIHFGKSGVTGWSAYHDPSQVFEKWDTFASTSQWTVSGGSWSCVDQQRPQVFDYHLLNAHPAASAVYGGTPIWTGNDGIRRFIAFAGSWEGLTSNNQGNRQWMIPWELVLYEEHGTEWYRWGNVLTGEWDGFNHASAIPMWVWEGDGSNLGTSGWLYMIVGTTTIATGDFASWIFVNKSGKNGRTWEVLNGGKPVADFSCVSDGVNRGRFSQLLYENGYYYLFYAQPHTAPSSDWRAGYLYGNSASILQMLNDSGTITPSSVWTDGGTILSPASGIEEAYCHKKADNSWLILFDQIGSRNLRYASCTAGNFGTSMNSTHWSTQGDVTDLDDMYEWSRQHLHDPHLKFSGSDPVMIYGAEPVSAMTCTKAVGFATHTAISQFGWTPTPLSKRVKQASDISASFQYLKLNSYTPSARVIECQATLGGEHSTSFAGIIWRAQDENNYFAWFVDDQSNGISYGKRSGGVWTKIATFDPATIGDADDIFRGEEYALRVIFDGATTTLQYRRFGWEWATAYEDISLTDANIGNSGSIYLFTYSGAALFDLFRTYEEATFAIETVALYSNTPSSLDFGAVQENTTHWANGAEPTWPLQDNRCYFTISNDLGNGALTIQIKIDDFNGGTGWNIVSGTPGVNEARVTVWESGESLGDALILSNSFQNFLSLPVATSKKWELRLEVGDCTDEVLKAATLTLSDGLQEVTVSVTVNPTALADPPSVTTVAASYVTNSSARLNGNLTDLGDAGSVTVSFVYGEVDGGPYPNETSGIVKTETGIYYTNIISLDSEKTYYFKAKAVGIGTSYGSQLQFTTLSPEEPPGVAGSFKVFVDWNNDGDFGDSYEDISSYVRSWECQYGRNEDLSPAEAGWARILLDDPDYRFVPDNDSSPLYPYVLPRRRVKISGYISDVEYVIWKGFIDDYRVDPDRTKRQCLLVCVDGQDRIARAEVDTTLLEGVRSGDVIDDILDDAGWSAAERLLDEGNESYSVIYADKDRALSFIRKMELSEFGFFYISAEGNATWEDRFHRSTGAHLVDQCTVTENAFVRIYPNNPLKGIRNRIILTAQPKTKAGSLSVIWSLQENAVNSNAPYIAPGQTLTFGGYFVDSYGTRNIAGDVVSPLVSGTDYIGKSSAAGADPDRTSDLSIESLTVKAGSVEASVKNNGATGLYLATLQCRGKIYTDEPSLEIVAQDATSITAYGLCDLQLDLPYYISAETMRGWAEYQLAIRKDPISSYEIQLENGDGSWFSQQIQRRVSDRIRITESRLNIDASYFIEKIKHSFDTKTNVLKTSWIVTYAGGSGGTWWILGTSQLGVDTILAW